MQKFGVRDTHGTRWSVRARQLRSTEIADPVSDPEQNSLRRRLAATLSPHPAVVVDPLRGFPGAWRTPGDSADIELRQARAAHPGPIYGSAGAIRGIVGLIALVRDEVDHLRTPLTDTWLLEVTARGRIRRWARWEVQGAEAVERTAVATAAALASGRVPELPHARLVDVVDQRPACAPRRSSALGQARTAC